MICGQGDGGFAALRGPEEIELPGQWYDLEADRQETADQWSALPELRASMLSRPTYYRESGFSHRRSVDRVSEEATNPDASL